MSTSERPVMLLVLGPHRSGTSVTARMLECLGARPSDRLHEPLPNNPLGFFEDVDVERFDEYELLPALGARWHDVMPPDCAAIEALRRSELVAKARDIVRRNFGHEASPSAGTRAAKRMSVLKEPRITVLLPFWLDVLEGGAPADHAPAAAERDPSIEYDVRFVCAVRDPLSVARSLEARDGLPIAHGAMVYASNWIAAHRAMGDRPAAYVAYDALLSDPAAALAGVARELGIGIPADFHARVDHARATFLDPGLRHASAPAHVVAAEPALPRIATAVFDALVAASEGGPGRATAARRAIAGLHGQLLPLLPILRAHDRLFAAHSELRAVHANLADEASGLRAAVREADALRARRDELVQSLAATTRQLADAVARSDRLLDEHAVERAAREHAFLEREHAFLEREHAFLERERVFLERERELAREALDARARLEAEHAAAREAEQAAREVETRLAAEESRSAGLEAALAASQSELARAAEASARADALVEELRITVRRREHALDVVESSLSWRMTSPARTVRDALRPKALRRRRDVRALLASGFFDPVHYALQLPVASREGLDLPAHYLDEGARQGLRPSPFFDSRHYVDAYPDVERAGIDPLLHFVRYGRREGRRAHAHDLRVAARDPHESAPDREARLIRESGAFDAAYYLDANADVRADGMDPITHYVLHGWREGRNPSATFDTRFYLREHLRDDFAGECPLVHYVRHGRHERLATSEAYRAEAARQRAANGAGGALAALRRTSAMLQVSIAQQGGVLRASRRAVELLRTEGAGGILRGVREQLRNADRTLSSRPGTAQVAGSPSVPADLSAIHRSAEPIPSSCRVLFVGCDGHLAGSQVLLLNLLRWLRAHTGVEVGTILLGGGELVEQYAACGPVVVWPELVRALPKAADRRAHLAKTFGKPDLVYGNTVLAAAIYGELEPLGVPILTHVHELEKSIRSYVAPEVVDALRDRTQRFIACSAPVAENLAANHGVGPDRLRTIEAFIPARRTTRPADRAAAREALGILPDARVVVGCGTIYWRKGVDLFVEAAIRLKEQGAPVPEFIWIGAHHWDADPQSRELMAWKAIEDRIAEHGLGAKIRFTGPLSDPRTHFEAADVFFLPSREDPYPLVCLEAAQAGTPVVCFEGAGGMPDFVSDDAGIVVPFLDVDAAASAIRALVEDPERRDALGRSAAAKVARLHVDDVAVPAILDEVHRLAGTSPLVSVVVPVYNHAAFLERRMESILGQTFRDLEIIVLDDASTDGSLEVARRYAHLPNVRIVANEANSGSAFRQWAKGIGLARGRFVWIAEGDDACAPDFLHRLLPSLADPEVTLAFADSRVVDEEDRPLEDYRAYYAALDPAHWMMDHRVPAETEINAGLGVKNTIPNVSATVFRREDVEPGMLEDIASMRFAGDWMFYVQLVKGRRIAFRSLPLNVHRKHSRTLTHQFNNDPERMQSLLDEVRLVHQWVAANYPLTESYRRRLAEYLAVQVESLFPGAAAEGDERRYPIARALAEVDASIARAGSVRRRVVFVTTNDHSHDGGSEQLWIHAALAMAKAGHAVMAVIRRWDPEPYFLEEFRRNGIEIAFKDAGPESTVRAFAPDLVVVNIGDQDDGADWYEHCRAAGLRYVIVNHLTKEPRYWPIRPELQDRVRMGNLGAERVLFTSRNNRSLMERRLGCAIPHAGTFHNPLFLDRSRSLPFPPVDGAIRVAMPARLLDVHKGQRIAIEVFSMPKWRERPIELHLYGNGPDEAALRELAGRAGSARIHFHEPRWELPHPDMEAIWRGCHALLMSSYMEGMPLVLLNAMFYGRVPIVTDIGGHREVVEDGIGGFIASEPTVDAIDEALERAWQRRAEWESIGARAREAMLRFAPADPVADLVEKLLLAIAGSRPRNGAA